MSLFGPKILRVEVTEGIDIESGAFLTGDRITVGTGANDTLCLGAGDITTEHLTLQKQPGGKGWEYFSSDRGVTQIDKGNPRTGTVRPGMWFRLGNETRVDILSVPMPDELKDTGGDGEKTEVPLAVALPILALMVAGFAAFMMGFGRSGDGEGGGLITTAWYLGSEPVTPYLDVCLETGATPTAGRVPQSAPDALFRAHSTAAGSRADEIRDALAERVRTVVIDAHLLVNEGRYLEASQSLRGLERMLPVGEGDCPILGAARTDIAILTLQGGG